VALDGGVVREPADVAAVEVHDVDVAVARAAAREGDPERVRGPRRLDVVRAVARREVDRVGAIRVDAEDREAAPVARAVIGDLPVRRVVGPGRLEVLQSVRRELREARLAALERDDVDGVAA
jgi:hypothetical protein